MGLNVREGELLIKACVLRGLLEQSLLKLSIWHRCQQVQIHKNGRLVPDKIVAWLLLYIHMYICMKG